MLILAMLTRFICRRST